MKHHRLYWFLSLLICISLSCNLSVPGRLEGVTSVSVSPQSGSGSFNASVKGTAHMDSVLRCYIPVDDENGTRVGAVDVFRKANMGASDTFDFSYDFPFTYTVAGNQTLICTLGTDSELSWSAEFTVTSGPEPQPSPSGQVLIEPDKLFNGELRFAVDKATANSAGMKPAMGCWPSTYYDDGSGYLKITADGTIEGFCAWKTPSSKNPQVNWNTSGTMNGTYNPINGEVKFYLDTEADYPAVNNMKITVSFDGTGSFTTASHAEGSATFHSTCQSPDDHPSCGVPPPGSTAAATATWDVTGTVPWTMDFTLAP
jgi:hypothetical protein